MFAKIDNQNNVIAYPVDLKLEFPDKSFPPVPTQDDLPPLYVIVTPTLHPTVSDTEVFEGVEGTPTLINDVWTQTWVTRTATVNEIAAKKQALVKTYADGIQRYMDFIVSARNYDSIISACSYAASNHVRYGVEGRACLQWREDVWDAAYLILDDITNGRRAIPTVAALINELPKLTWPA